MTTAAAPRGASIDSRASRISLPGTAAAMRASRARVTSAGGQTAPAMMNDVFTIDPAIEQQQVESLARLRSRRDGRVVEAALHSVAAAAKAGENVVPACVDAVRAYATIGEVVARLREVHGSWVPSTTW